jgi:hypothetical protein
VVVACHKPGEREHDVVRCHGNKRKIGLTGYGRSADLIERLALKILVSLTHLLLHS